jgi:hypothetical protein
MRGSIAIWHDAIADEAEGYAPRVEVHVNIWRNRERDKRGHYDLFDIGFRFKELRSLRTLSLSLPFIIEKEHLISDLFETMRDEATLSAIFNETLSPSGLHDGGHTFVASRDKRVQFYVAKCPEDERELWEIGVGDDRASVITLNDQFFNRLRSRVGDHYFRLRIKVPPNQKNGFVSTNRPKDSAFLSTISTNEIIEFRLNERRNFSPAIRERLQQNGCSLINISTVHYFLIRDMGVEMTQSHTSFKKMRRLEPDMWDRYLKDCPGFSPDKMIIYHWSTPSEKSPENFTALATFRAYYTGSLFLYGAVVVLLGAMGSAFQSMMTSLLMIVFGKSWTYGCSSDKVEACGAVAWNFTLLALMFLTLAMMVYCQRQKP